MSRLVFIGSVNVDTITVVPHVPAPDERLVAETIVSGYGGNSATAAVAAARLGGDVAFIGPIADDEQGERVRADLEREGVDTSGVIPVPAGEGGASVILVDRSTRTRAICTRPMPPFELTPRARELVANAAWVHVDHLGWSPVRGLDTTPRLSVDAGNPIPDFTPRDVDLYVPTTASLQRAYGDLPIAALLDRALADGARVVVATDGAAGAYAAEARGRHVHVPGFEVEVVSTLGAGDVFHGALLVAVDRGLPLAEAVRYANAAAALSCRAIDGRSGIPTRTELEEWLAARS